jgi:hypothetical protein
MSYEIIPAVYADSAKIRFFYGTEYIFNSLSLRTHFRADKMKDAQGNDQVDEVAISQQEMPIVLELLEEAVYDLGAYMFKLVRGVSNSVFFNTIIQNPLIPNTIVGTLTSGYVVSDGGLNYEVGDIITVVQSGGAANGKFVVLTVDAGGIILTVEQTEAGSNYSVADDLATTVNRGSGAGATIDIVSVQDIAAAPAFDVNSSGFELVDNSAYDTNMLLTIDKKILNCIRQYILRSWFVIINSAGDVTVNNDLYQKNLKELKKFTFELRLPTMAEHS